MLRNPPTILRRRRQEMVRTSAALWDTNLRNGTDETDHQVVTDSDIHLKCISRLNFAATGWPGIPKPGFWCARVHTTRTAHGQRLAVVNDHTVSCVKLAILRHAF